MVAMMATIIIKKRVVIADNLGMKGVLGGRMTI